MTNISRIQTVSSFMAWVCILPLILLPLWVIWFWADFANFVPRLAGGQIARVIDMQTITTSQILLAAILNLLVLSILLLGLWHLRKLFLEFRRGAFFTDTSVRHLHRFALMILISAVLKVILTAALSVILTWNNAPGQKALVVQLGSNEFAMLLIAATIFIVSWILKEGQRLAAENAEFV